VKNKRLLELAGIQLNENETVNISLPLNLANAVSDALDSMIDMQEEDDPEDAKELSAARSIIEKALIAANK